MKTTCSCKTPADCKFAAVRTGPPFLFDVCRGAVLSPAERDVYVAAWQRQQTAAADRPAVPELPPLLDRVWTFTKAIARHTRGGFRKRTKTRISELLEICENCPADRYTGTHCAECGCCVGAATDAWLNKLAWESERCPLDYWE